MKTTTADCVELQLLKRRDSFLRIWNLSCNSEITRTRILAHASKQPLSASDHVLLHIIVSHEATNLQET